MGPQHALDSSLTEYGDPEFSRFLRRAFLASAGFDAEELDKWIVGIAHTSSDCVTCHREMPQLVDAMRRGVQEAGGLALAFPVTALGEILLSPTSMLLRNLAAIEAEELVRAQPMDAAVFVGGCDKTVPAQLLAAVSANVPFGIRGGWANANRLLARSTNWCVHRLSSVLERASSRRTECRGHCRRQRKAGDGSMNSTSYKHRSAPTSISFKTSCSRSQ
jgi:dihydroxyacid dehydratase/phosphogluconate dehydratase